MKIPTGLVKAATTVGNCLKANSPKIFMGLGVISTVAAVVDAVCQTPKAIDILEDHKESVEKCKEALELEDPRYGEKEYKKEMFQICASTAGQLAKCYARPTLLLIGGICFFGAANKVLSGRNKALASALTATVDAAMSDRKKVEDALGVEKADAIFNGLTEEKYTEETVDEDGKKKKVKGTRVIADPSQKSPYAFYWSEDDLRWDQIPEYNEAYIHEVETMINRKLYGEKKDNGNWLYHPTENFHVSLNDIRGYFLEPKKAWTQLGQIAGCDASHPDGRLTLRFKPVSIRCEDNPNMYKEAYLITPNLPGSICPEFIQ